MNDRSFKSRPAPAIANPKIVIADDRTLPAVLKYPADNAFSAQIRAYSNVASWVGLPDYHLAYGSTQSFEGFKFESAIGIPEGAQAEQYWKNVRSDTVKLIKSHYWLLECWNMHGAPPDAVIVFQIPTFMRDLGYDTYKLSGTYRLEQKQRVVKLIRTIMNIKMAATWSPTNTRRIERISGPIWSEGLLHEYGDLFGQANVGEPGHWDPATFSYRPGPWFWDEQWRIYNTKVGRISSKLLGLENDSDQWAIIIGGYLGTLLPMAKEGIYRIDSRKLLRAVDLAQSPRAKKHIGETSYKLERACDRLREIEVIRDWNPGAKQTYDLLTNTLEFHAAFD